MFSFSKLLLLLAIIIVVLYGAKVVQAALGRRGDDRPDAGGSPERTGGRAAATPAIEADLVRCAACGVYVDPKGHACPGRDRTTP